MEPRPPRPRSLRPFETPGSPETAGIGERLYPVPGDPVNAPGAEAYPPGVTAEPSLLPRRQRRQRGALRGVAVAVVAIGAIAALGWIFRDAVQGLIVPPAPSPTVVAAQVTAPGTPEAAPQSAALPNALATVTPTAEARSTATAEQEEEEAAPAGADELTTADEPDRDISVQTLPLLELLPTQEQVPEGLVLVDEAERSKAEVVAALGSTEEAAQLLDDWGWSGNAFREYIADEAAIVPGGTSFLNVSVHRFADAESAANAMVFFSDQVVFGQGLQEIEPPAVGETARLLEGAPDGVPLSILYAQQGPIMYRIGGSTSSAEGNPTADVLEVAGEIIPGQAAEG